MTARPHLLLAVTADGYALSLVDSAFQLSRSTGATWSVVAIETPGRSLRGPAPRGALLEALDRAEQLGATVTRISTAGNTRSAVVSSLVHRAVSEGATTLMLGRRRDPGRGWSDPGHGLGDLAEALSGRLPGVTLHLVLPPGQGTIRPPETPKKRWGWIRQTLRAWPSVCAALFFSTAAGAALEQFAPPDNAVMIYLVGVVYVASKAGQAAAIATVLGSIFLYDLIFVQPRWSLNPSEPQYWLAFLVMMVVGIIISRLAARTREQAMLAEARAQQTEALKQLAVALGRARDRSAVAASLCAAVHSAVGADSTVLFVPQGTTDREAEQALPVGFDRHWADQALERGFEVGPGMSAGADQPLRYLPLVAGNSTFGLLVLNPPSPDNDSLEDQHLVRALANQAAIALERADLEGRSMAAAVEAEVERTRNTLLAGISHDFRTPLTTIVGSATLLLEQAPAIDEARRSMLLQTLLSEAQRLHVLTSNLLDLTRLDEGAIQLRPEWCPADELLESALKQLGQRLRNHQLVVAVPQDALVWCDPRLIDQVLVNLLDNATRHTPPGGTIRVSIEITSGQWRLTVHDDGPGIPAGQEQAIFRKFHQAADDSDSTGKGLGLAICAAIASLHGGSIAAVNDAGARLTLALPQSEPPDFERDDPT